MLPGEIYTFQCYDIFDLTILLSLDGGSTWESTSIVDNLITDPEASSNQVDVSGMERILVGYDWTVPNIKARECIVKFVDNDTGEELLGSMFFIGSDGGSSNMTAQNVFTTNIDIFSSIYGLY